MRSVVLDEIIGLNGPGDAQTDFCGSCLTIKTTLLYCCLECSYGLLLCKDCTVVSHQALPLHQLEVCLFHTRALSLAHIICSAGRTVFSTEWLYTPSGLSVTSSMEAPPVLLIHHFMIFLLSTSTVGTNCKSNSAAARKQLHHLNTWLHRLKTIASSYKCVGIQRPSAVLGPRSPSTFLKHTTKSHSKGNSTCMISTLLLCKNPITKDDQSRW